MEMNIPSDSNPVLISSDYDRIKDMEKRALI